MSFTNFTHRQEPLFLVEPIRNGRPANVSATRTNSTIRTCLGKCKRRFALKQVFCGTELNITQEGIPAAIPSGGLLPSAGRNR